MILWLVCLASLAAALVAAVLLASRNPDYPPVVLVLGGGLLADFVMGHRELWGLNWLLVPPHATLRPLYHLSNALVTSWPALLAGLAWMAFPGPERTEAPPADRERLLLRHTAVKAVLAWLVANAALVLADPGAVWTQRALLGGELAALLAGAAAAVVGWGRSWGLAARAAIWLLGVELVVVALGPFRTSIYTNWHLARVAYTLGFAALAGLQVAAWRRLRPRRQDPAQGPGERDAT